jgi:hypothetical protein
VLAHLVALPAPQPGPTMADRLRTAPARQLDCAIGQAVDAAVAVRSGVLARSLSPADLAAHVADALRAQIRTATVCPVPEWEWLPQEHRWDPVYRKLRRKLRTDPAAGRHPDSGAWEQRYGRVIPGPTCADQLDLVRQWRQAARRKAAAIEELRHGTTRPSALEAAIGARRADPDWTRRLEAAGQELRIPEPLLVSYVR